ncbi:hypothetical protein M8818_003011 [Zalaria obscura]|uniref:Uncharacterized protein n=1 Tax=Zalaria obscura TaxID=2024903 RepID=A0ACC3SGA4_9PEZI
MDGPRNQIITKYAVSKDSSRPLRAGLPKDRTPISLTGANPNVSRNQKIVSQVAERMARYAISWALEQNYIFLLHIYNSGNIV